MSEEVIENKKKYEKAKDFVGWISTDGKLKVVGIAGRNISGYALYKVTCTECSKDPELFRQEYFLSAKSNLIKGQKPCGCSKGYHWEYWQYLILANRAGEKRSFIIHGLAEKFHGALTKIDCECRIDGYRWTTSIDKIINKGTGCKKCRYNKAKLSEQDALIRFSEVCYEAGYTPVGTIGKYSGTGSMFEYICQKHGNQTVKYKNFIYTGNRCTECWKDRQTELGNCYGRYPEKYEEQDFLYVLNFDDQFIKVGRTFDVIARINKLKALSKIESEDIIKLRIFTATHKEIWDLEQYLLRQLRSGGFQYKLDWTNECFYNSCLPILNKLLSDCQLKRLL